MLHSDEKLQTSKNIKLQLNTAKRKTSTWCTVVKLNLYHKKANWNVNKIFKPVLKDKHWLKQTNCT